MLPAFDEKRMDHLMSKLAIGDQDVVGYVDDLLTFGLYPQEVFSQFGLGLSGFIIRHTRTNVLMTVKVTEEGVPLVAFVTAATTRGCVEQMFDLLASGRLKWQRDKYPWI
jgi:hypothetical protein